ncbi:hypothetical protein D9756_008415 [Leucocoprinus leucothites]|uniref:AAA+ ATPase domain-containing protein n=1 Tax=Leucocoprinus leucothites TaxID=201217 RepID=A0A8H5CZV1_9AGAR|nr:hypothetical protein D9756_008415 [Leucoagaricus leucothites]
MDTSPYMHMFGDRNFDRIDKVVPVVPHELSGDDIVILVMGPKGAGKSTFIQAVVGTHYNSNGIGCVSESATSETYALRILFKDGDKPNIVLVDTPGFENDNQVNNQNFEPLIKWYNASGTKNSTTSDNDIMRRVSGILLLHPIADNYRSGNFAANLQWFKKSCDKDIHKRVVLTTTMWPNESSPGYSPKPQREYEKYEQDLNSLFRQTMILSGSKPCRFTGTSLSAQEIVNEIIKAERSRSIEVTPISAHELTEDDIIIAVMGPTGVGKSSFIQLVAGGDYNTIEVGEGLGSTTSEVKALRIMFKNAKNRNIVLIDTPGFDDTFKYNHEVLETIVEWLSLSGKKSSRTGEDRRISGILYLHRITDIRFSGSITENFELFKKLCGKDFYKRVILTTTMWPDENNSAPSLELKNEYERREQELKDDHWRIMIKSGSKARRFLRTLPSAEQIINEIVETELRNQEQPLMQIQSEMASGSLWETQAGKYFIHKIWGLSQTRKYIRPRLFKERDFRTIDKVMPVSTHELTENDMIIVVMGPPGAGKSTLIQVAARTSSNIEHQSQAEVSALRITFKEQGDTSIVLVDTPGFGHAEKNDLHVLETLAQWFKDVGSNDHGTCGSPRISGIFYLHPIAGIESSADAVWKNFEIFQKLCGKDFCDRVILTTSMWPSEQDAAYWYSVYRENKLKDKDWRWMIAWGSKVCRFDGTWRSVERMVNEIVIAEREKQERLHERILQIQREIAREFKPLPSTQAGQHLRVILIQLVQQQNEELKRLKRELRGSTSSDVELSAKFDKLQQEKRANEEVIHRLKRPRVLNTFNKIPVRPLSHILSSSNVNASQTPSKEHESDIVQDLMPFNDLRVIKELFLDNIHDVMPVSVHELTANDIIIVVMGPTGAGKSTFIKTVTGTRYDHNEVGHRLKSATSEVSALRVTFTASGNTNLVLVDTPGFDDTYKSDLEILKTIARWLNDVAQTKDSRARGRETRRRISGILYMHRITDIRMTGSIMKNFEMFQKLCGNDFFNRIILTTTMWPNEHYGFDGLQELEREFEAREQDLKETYWKFMTASGSKVRRFTGTPHSAQRIINEIVISERDSQEQFYVKIVQIQREMAYESKPVPGTQAGKHLHGVLAELVERKNRTLDELMTELSNPTEQDPDEIERLLDKLRALRHDKDTAMKDMNKLDNPRSFTLGATIRGLVVGFLNISHSTS